MITSFLVTFLVLFLVIGTIHSKESNIWLKALVLAVSLSALGLAAQTFGVTIAVLAMILAFLIVIQVLNYSFSSAILFLLIVGGMIYVIDWGTQRYLMEKARPGSAIQAPIDSM